MPIPTPILFLLFVIPTANLMILVFLGLYIRQLNKEKKELEDKTKVVSKKEAEIDNDFHKSVNQTIEQERNIIENASKQAEEILSNAKHISSDTRQTIDSALREMATEALKQAGISSNEIVVNQKNSLSQITNQSVSNFQNLTKQFEIDFQKQTQDFRNNILNELQKEIENYKSKKLQDAVKTVNTIIQEVSEKVLNKSISTEDHQNLIIESLQKARKDGLFD